MPYDSLFGINEQLDSESHNLKTWISDLPSDLRKVPINQLAIPGSHSGLAYRINSRSKISGDCEWKKLSFIWKSQLARWSSCQSVSVTKQLECGVRYFDVRVEYDEDDDNFWCTHLMKAELLGDALRDVETFLNAHPKEIVILDFQHFLNFGDRQRHEDLIESLHGLFGQRLCPERPISDLTVEWMNSVNHQIIVVYRNDTCDETSFFRGCRFPVIYPRSSEPETMIEIMAPHIEEFSSPNWCLVIQTVSELDVFDDKFPYAKFRRKRAKSALPHILTFLVSYPKPNVNVVVADFVELRNFAFSRAVVNLNYNRTRADTNSLLSKLRRKSKKLRDRNLSSST